MVREEIDPVKRAKLRKIADAYNRMLYAFFAEGEDHKDLPGKTIGRVKRAIKEIHEEDIESKIREILQEFIS